MNIGTLLLHHRVPHDKWGEVPVAAVILQAQTTVSDGDILQWTNKRVDAKFQRLHKVVIMDSFPASVAGKTLKRKIRDSLL
ncbi:hypothetical protein [Desulfopila sp. IMCC35008]|uniref:AMP-binding enzyme n=1 Tax=Desulfopila sp. IMCC35008 TaxID=2653858 RepID=UPI0013D51E7D|nr:hypothetical protein [Desulfopila sp. IMCC35008]